MLCFITSRYIQLDRDYRLSQRRRFRKHQCFQIPLVLKAFSKGCFFDGLVLLDLNKAAF